jgi:hypothetical protein
MMHHDAPQWSRVCPRPTTAVHIPPIPQTATPTTTTTNNKQQTTTNNQPPTNNKQTTTNKQTTNKQQPNNQQTTTTTINNQQTTTQQPNKQQPTNNKQQPTINKQQPTTNKQQTTTNNQQQTNNNQTTINNQQPTTNKQQPNKQQTTTNKQTTNNQQTTNKQTNNQQSTGPPESHWSDGVRLWRGRVQRRDAGSGMGVHEGHGDRIAQMHTEPVEAVRSDTVPPAWVMAEKRNYSPFGALSMYFWRLLEAFGVFWRLFWVFWVAICGHFEALLVGITTAWQAFIWVAVWSVLRSGMFPLGQCWRFPFLPHNHRFWLHFRSFPAHFSLIHIPAHFPLVSAHFSLVFAHFSPVSAHFSPVSAHFSPIFPPPAFQPTPACNTTCHDGTPRVLSRAASVYSVGGFFDKADAIAREVMKHGPVEAAFTVYEDFVAYKSGVYRHTTGNALGGHAVAIVGFGTTEQGEKYVGKRKEKKKKKKKGSSIF